MNLAVSKKKQSQLPEEQREKPPAPGQLWSVIEFSSRFPELTMELVSVLKQVEQTDKAKEDSQEELKFPDLIPPDPRMANLTNSRKKEHNAADEDFGSPAEEDKDPAMPAAGRKMRICLCLLAAAFLIFMLLWRGLS